MAWPASLQTSFWKEPSSLHFVPLYFFCPCYLLCSADFRYQWEHECRYKYWQSRSSRPGWVGRMLHRVGLTWTSANPEPSLFDNDDLSLVNINKPNRQTFEQAQQSKPIWIVMIWNSIVHNLLLHSLSVLDIYGRYLFDSFYHICWFFPNIFGEGDFSWFSICKPSPKTRRQSTMCGSGYMDEVVTILQSL